MDKTAYLGLDVGGTGAKAGVFDAAGRPLGFARVRLTPTVSGDGHVEVPIEAVYEAGRDAVRQAVRESGARVVAMAVSSQGQTFAPLDAAGRSLHPAILWYDSRAAAEAEWLRQAVAARRPADLPPIQPIASAAKILWLRRHYPEAMAGARRFLLLPDYFAFRLTGQAVTDPATASTTGLYAHGAPDYVPEALAAAEIERETLARIQPPGSVIGPVFGAAAEEWGMATGALLVVGTNDQYAGALGAGNCRPGIVSETTGTCLALVTLAERLPDALPAGLLSGTFPVAPYHCALAYAKTAGVVLDWFRGVFCPEKTFADLEALAAGVPVGCSGLTALPHFDGMVSPAPNPAARGAFCGLTLAHSLGDMYRALLESVAFSLRENLDLLAENGLPAEAIRSIGGGARSDLWLQMKADVAGRPVERPAVTEAATLGSALLAALGHGRFPSLAEASASWYRVGRLFAPDAERHAAYAEPYERYRGLCRTL